MSLTPQPAVLRFAAIQLRVGSDKATNVQRAVDKIREAVSQKPPSFDLKRYVVALPECFNSPYGTGFFDEYAETVPGGYTTERLADVAKELGVFVVGGTIPERGADRKLYNTCTVFNPEVIRFQMIFTVYGNLCADRYRTEVIQYL